MAKKKRRRTKQTSLQRWGYVIGIMLILVFGAVWLNVNKGPVQSDTVQVNSVSMALDELTLGKAIYAENCAACHGVNLEGEENWQEPNEDGSFKAPPHDETGHTWHHSDAYLLSRIRFGTQDLDTGLQSQSNMPAYEDVLTNQEIEAVLGYIKSNWSADIQEIQAER